MYRECKMMLGLSRAFESKKCFCWMACAQKFYDVSVVPHVTSKLIDRTLTMSGLQKSLDKALVCAANNVGTPPVSFTVNDAVKLINDSLQTTATFKVDIVDRNNLCATFESHSQNVYVKFNTGESCLLPHLFFFLSNRWLSTVSRISSACATLVARSTGEAT